MAEPAFNLALFAIIVNCSAFTPSRVLMGLYYKYKQIEMKNSIKSIKSFRSAFFLKLNNFFLFFLMEALSQENKKYIQSNGKTHNLPRSSPARN